MEDAFQDNDVDMVDSKIRKLVTPRKEDFEWASDFYHAESIHQHYSKDQVVFAASENDAEDIEDFLQEYQPSKIERDGIGSICVTAPDINQMNRDTKYDGNLKERLQETWVTLKSSGQRVTFDTICLLAHDYGVLGGKWLIYVDPGIKTDFAWATVARLVVSGCCGRGAVILTHNVSHQSGKHRISVITDDFRNQDEIFRIDKKIRKAGFKGEMKYKPDIFSTLGIFRENPWHIKPSIYISHYDVIQQKSKITVGHASTVVPANTTLKHCQ